jgi:hypothetical protein
LEQYHGRAVRLLQHDPRSPFHGAFLFHEMRLRGFWPLSYDRPISLPILWQTWIRTNSDGDPVEIGDDGDTVSDVADAVNEDIPDYRHSRRSDDRGSMKWLILTNPFANVAELDTLKRSFAQQPNWKAAVVEGESWDGTAQENISKWKGLVGPP